MEEKIIIAGFGGQGVVLAGNVLAYAALNEGKNILGMVSYGAEVRGGASNSSVIISDDEIDSPIIENADIAILMSQQAYEKFHSKIREHGLLLINSSEINDNAMRDDITIVQIPATEIAREMGNPKIANLILIGALVEKTKLLKQDSLIESLRKVFTGRRKDLIYINESAIRKGIGLIND